MYKFLFAALVFSFIVFRSSAQTTIAGTVKTNTGTLVEGASITLLNTYRGTTSFSDGTYLFTTSDTGRVVLEISMNGFHTFSQVLSLNCDTILIDARLRETITDLKALVINAGSFEAGDRKRATILKSVDIVTTAGQQADIVAALKTLPGAQQVGESEGLFVRGGTGAETKVFIDGMMVANPFYSSVPEVAQRGRFSPLLFKGTNFSSGGYSAQFGQALSAALVLESLDLPSRSETNWIISSAQASVTGQHLARSGKRSVGGGFTYSNLAPYFGVVQQKFRYQKAPQVFSAELHARQKTKTGLFKFYGYANGTALGYTKPVVGNKLQLESFTLANRNFYSNVTYTGRVADHWTLFAGTSLAYNQDKISLGIHAADSLLHRFTPVLNNYTNQAKIMITKKLGGLNALHVGTEYQHTKDDVAAPDSIPFTTIRDDHTAVFTEAEIHLSANITFRAGMRFEHSSLLQQSALSPRLALAYKLGAKSQLSAAFGHFYQKPETRYLYYPAKPGYAKAVHYMLNYQVNGNGQTLRIELFHKKYTDLVSYAESKPRLVGNEGHGYGQGVEFFWRDKKTIKTLDYWIAYSFLDTKRMFLDYPSKVQPSFAARHTLNIVVKKFVPVISSHFSLTYTHASGRPYYNPNRDVKAFMSDRSIDLNTLAMQVNYLTQIGKAYTVLIANVSNVLGNNQVYGYRYATTKNSEGTYAADAITPQARRFFFIGVYISIGTDRRNTILD